jgi:hypothetical protein
VSQSSIVPRTGSGVIPSPVATDTVAPQLPFAARNHGTGT